MILTEPDEPDTDEQLLPLMYRRRNLPVLPYVLVSPVR